MTTRLLSLFVACASLLTSGCDGLSEPPKAEEKPATEEKANLPIAPAPRPKKTTAELLVGVWKVVKMDGEEVPRDWYITMEFTRQGKVIIYVNDQKNPPRRDIGTYKLAGDTIRVTTPATAEKAERSWDITIESISGDQLATASGPVTERSRKVFAREVEK